MIFYPLLVPWRAKTKLQWMFQQLALTRAEDYPAISSGEKGTGKITLSKTAAQLPCSNSVNFNSKKFQRRNEDFKLFRRYRLCKATTPAAVCAIRGS